MELTLIFSLIAIYLVTFYLVWSVYRAKQKVVKEIVYVPSLSAEMSREIKLLNSKLLSNEVKYEKLKQDYEKQLKINSDMKKELDFIFDAQNKYNKG